MDTSLLKEFFSGDDEVFNGDECPTTTGEFLRGKIIDKTTSDTIRVEIYSGDIVLMEIGRKHLWILYYENTKSLSTPTAYRRFESNYTINAKTFNDVLAVECSQTQNNCNEGITKFYFAKNRGLIGFEKDSFMWALK